jgi:hypothetical protein
MQKWVCPKIEKPTMPIHRLVPKYRQGTIVN